MIGIVNFNSTVGEKITLRNGQLIFDETSKLS